MSNSFIELKLIARKALPRLIDNLVMPNLCYKDYSDTYADLGDTIQVKKPVVFSADDFYVGDTVIAQDITENSVEVKLDKIATVDVNVNALEAVHNMSEAKFMSDFIEPATAALAEKINTAGTDEFMNIPNLIGTAGTTPSGLADFAAARKFLNKAKAPLADRVAIWDVDADAAFTQIGNLVKVNESGSPRALREGEIGRVFGIDNYMTQAIEGHTSIAAGSPAIDGAATAGATTIHVDGLTTGFGPGDMFTIASDSTKYTVVSGSDLSSTDQDIVICPALQKNAANDAVITVISTKTVNNLVFHKNAIAFVTRPLHQPAGIDSYVTSYNGFSLRVVRGYDIATKTEKMSMDVLYAYKVVYPEIAARYLG